MGMERKCRAWHTSASLSVSNMRLYAPLSLLVPSGNAHEVAVGQSFGGSWDMIICFFGFLKADVSDISCLRFSSQHEFSAQGG